jgi:hypothetical protein
MIDCSRGGVLKQSSVFTLMRHCALMGINMIQLYTEDTYEMEGETFFGYLRGGYTRQELISMDDYAFALGIELVPCIQTLGHLGQILQWPKYHVYRDTNEVLLGNWDETYNLIEKMITTISSPLRSKRIHIGLDEAGGVGEGRYRQIFGYEEPTRVFLNHLRRVQDICKKLGLQPMIWSDSTFPFLLLVNRPILPFSQCRFTSEGGLTRVHFSFLFFSFLWRNGTFIQCCSHLQTRTIALRDIMMVVHPNSQTPSHQTLTSCTGITITPPVSHMRARLSSTENWGAQIHGSLQVPGHGTGSGVHFHSHLQRSRRRVRHRSDETMA